METQHQTNTLLNLNLSLSASPEFTFIKASGALQKIPATSANGFALELETALPYENLAAVLNAYLQGRRFTISEGLIKQHAVVDTCKIYSGGNKLMVEVQFSGAFKGTAYVVGMPVYEASLQKIVLRGLAYDLKTNNILLRGAKWLFDKLILEALQKYTLVDLAPLYKKAAEQINGFLKKEWTKGIQASGAVTTLEVIAVNTQPQQLLIRCRCLGSVNIVITELHLKF